MIEFNHPEPKYKIGQTVIYTTKTEDPVSKLTFTNQTEVLILSIKFEVREFRNFKNDTVYFNRKFCYKYGISIDVNSNIFQYIDEPDIILPLQQIT